MGHLKEVGKTQIDKHYDCLIAILSRAYHPHGLQMKIWGFVFAFAFVMESQINSPRFSFAFAFTMIMLGTHKPQQQAALTK